MRVLSVTSAHLVFEDRGRTWGLANCGQRPDTDRHEVQF